MATQFSQHFVHQLAATTQPTPIGAVPVDVFNNFFITWRKTDPTFSSDQIASLAKSTGIAFANVVSSLALIQLINETSIVTWPEPHKVRPPLTSSSALALTTTPTPRRTSFVRDMTKLREWFVRAVIFAKSGLAHLEAITEAGGFRGIENATEAAISSALSSSADGEGGKGGDIGESGERERPLRALTKNKNVASDMLLFWFVIDHLGSYNFLLSSITPGNAPTQSKSFRSDCIGIVNVETLHAELFKWMEKNGIPSSAMNSRIYFKISSFRSFLNSVAIHLSCIFYSISGIPVVSPKRRLASGSSGEGDALGEPILSVVRKGGADRVVYNFTRINRFREAYRGATIGDAAVLRRWTTHDASAATPLLSTSSPASPFISFLACQCISKIDFAKRVRLRDNFDVCTYDTEALTMLPGASFQKRFVNEAIWVKAFASKKFPPVSFEIESTFTSPMGHECYGEVIITLRDGRTICVYGLSKNILPTRKRACE